MCELPAVGQRLAKLCNTLALVGAPPNACRGRGQRVGKGFSVVALFLAYPFKNGAYSVLENTIDTVFWSFPINFPSWGAVAPVSVHSCHLPGSTVQTPLSSTHPSFHLQIHNSTWCAMGTDPGMHRLCVQFFLCPAFHRLGVMFPCNSSNIPSCSS